MFIRVLVAVVLMLPVSASGADLVVWLVPLVRDDSPQYMASEQDLSAFNKEFGAGHPITVLNTTVPVLRDQLFVRNPEAAEPNWTTIIAQRQTLAALKRFATEKNITLDVRFIKWGRMFSTLNEALLSKNISPQFQPPDVVQIGSTWKAYFEKYASGTPGDRSIANDVSEPYTYDLRMLFYWRRLPGDDENSAITVNGNSWRQLLEQFHEYQTLAPRSTRAFLAMPISLTLNILHDYAPLVWAGHGDFISDNNKIDLTSMRALKLPLMLANSVSVSTANNPEPVRVVSFPEIGHVEGMEYFLSTKYRAIIEPVGFLKHWQKMFYKRYRDGDAGKQSSLGEFADYLGIAPLPVTFQGGSELMVTTQTRTPRLAADFVEFLASDTVHLSDLARNGYLPANLPDFGIDVMLAALSIPEKKQVQVKQALNQAWLNRRSYPAIPDWPIKVETLENLEAMQRVWRRIAQGNNDNLAIERITEVAVQTQYAINKRINPLIQLWDGSLRIWPVLAILLLVFLLVLLKVMYVVHRRQRGQILALLLFRGKYHSTLSAYGATVIDFLELPNPSLQEKLLQYGSHIAECYNHHIANMVKQVCLDLSGKSRSLNLYALVQQASDGANKEYYAATAKQVPLDKIHIDVSLKHWSVPYLGNILVVVIQEWFFNTYKNVQTDKRVSIKIGAECRKRHGRLSIISNVPFASDHSARLMERASPVKDVENWARSKQVSGQGLSLIRDLLWYSFKSRVEINNLKGCIELVIPIPVKYRRSE